VTYRLHGMPDMPNVPRPGVGDLATEAVMVLRSDSRTYRFLRTRLAFLLAATLLLDAVATVAMYALEHDHRRSGFHSLGGALFWVSAQLTTISSPMPNPVTTAGRVLDIVLEIWAITVAATLAGSLAAFFRARHVERESALEAASWGDRRR
jgi:uncharacterized membrane protein YdjX (TVP38/TMEM64 family)